MSRIAEPAVELVAYTAINPDVIEQYMAIDEFASEAETLIEFAGRGCYLSYHKPNPATADNWDYIQRTVLDMGHGSIAEHANVTLRLTGVSRAFLAELTRHRHLSFSVLSQRFVDESEARYVVPPAIVGDAEAQQVLEHSFNRSLEEYKTLVDLLTEQGMKRKQAREAARAVLPNMTETMIVVTGNMRTWFEVLNRRTAPDADAEMQEVAWLMMAEIYPLIPTLFHSHFDTETGE